MAADDSGSALARRGDNGGFGSLSRLKRGWTRQKPDEQDDDAARALRFITCVEELGSGWFWETDREGRLTYLSQGVMQQLSESGRSLLGESLCDVFVVGGDDVSAERTLRFHIVGRTSFSDYHVSTDSSGDRLWSISGRPLFDEVGQFRGFVGTGSDLTAKRRTEAEVARLAMFDSLTGLANRAKMQLSLDQLLARRQGRWQPLALMLLDLDRFKAVNDTLGHQTGDMLLKLVAQRLQRTVGDGALIGRRGGDEFEVVIIGECRRDALGDIAHGIVAALSQPYHIAGSSISIGCSIGISIAPDDGDTSETLVRNADLALYSAKGNGRGTHRFYVPELLALAQMRRQMEDDLRQALGDGQLHLVYQPVVGTVSGAITGYEALARWEHPRLGAISPAEFIPVAEDSGLIEPIGEWVLRTATLAAAQWPVPVRIAVNVSPIQFARPTLPLLVTSALAQSGLDPARLELEITESVFLGGSAATEATFRNLKALGVRLALDDFGTGYSSLGYLKTAPFDKIKIDQSFVRGIGQESTRNAAIVKAIVTLADAMDLETTAEGVEAQDEIELIRALGCTHIQGFVYGRPMSDAQVLIQLSGTQLAAPVGVKVSRPVRTRMLRSIWLQLDGRRIAARLRDVSAAGAMIDSFEPLTLQSDTRVAIEFVEGEPLGGVIRWVRGGRAGIGLDQLFDFREIKSPVRQQAAA
ncbi:EAL domain-containing protein [uncultured Sphingomonas sp.]|uniref:putative bifunctional diguanylate cyclase/phosphodiesterase n=1 Tax=uncultured Sphingomonas sp. TaxID=158754 RepID=UPI00261A5F7E|nr:EAL domain-containing protein [uncultured Sphingomonas sp.]